MEDQKSKQKLEAVRELLGEPVFISFSDYVLKLRRNLVALTIFIIFYQWLGLKISNVFGLDCAEIPRDKIDIFLAFYLVYTSVYFFSEAWETYLRWKIRLTGTFSTVPQPSSDNNESLRIISDLNVVNAIKLRDIGYCRGEQSYLFSIMAQAIYANSNDLEGNLKDKIELRSRISVDILELVKIGLERFQKGFSNFQKWQIGRFFFFDILAPFALTCIAFYMVLYKIIYPLTNG